MQQQELFSAPAQLKGFSVSLDPQHLDGPDRWVLTMSAVGTKSRGAVWSTTQHLSGARAITVASEIVAAAMLRLDGSLWDKAPQVQDQEAWERRLFTL